MEGEFAHLLGAAGDALFLVLEPARVMYLVIGVVVGLAIGLLPGIGGLTGYALLVPFTYSLDAYSAFAMLLGMHAVTSTSDTIPAVLFGVPGTSASQATVLDGLPMTRRGDAGRALSAGFSASLFGGLIGAMILAVTIPIIRPLVLAIGTPELLALTVFGIAMVSTLSGSAPLRGIAAACFGILVGMIGADHQSGQIRWAGPILYLWDGVPMLPVLLGIFALPELCDLAIARSALAEKVKFKALDGMLEGFKDTVKNWYLVLRCSAIGAVLGAIPGITGSVTDWIAYAHALQSEKGASETFGKGDVRGVIAPESANNSKEGGSLIPTIAFGVPGSAGQAILLSALMIHGLIPGPSMLSTNVDVTYSLVWSIALANIFGAGLCFLLSGQFARISTLRYTLVLPGIMAIVYVGAFQGSSSWGDLYALLIFGVIGWAMKRLRWPRPPLILGLVLGVLIERYMAISIMRYDAAWLLRPGVILLLGMALLAVLRPLIRPVLHDGFGILIPRGKPRLRVEDLAYVPVIGVATYMLIAAQDWAFTARIGPTVVATTMLLASGLSLMFLMFSRHAPGERGTKAATKHGIYMDLESSNEHALGFGSIMLRAGIFFGWFIGFLAVMSVIGLIPTVPILIVAFMRIEGRERWKLTLSYAAITTLLIYIVFERTLHIGWPSTFLGEMFPVLADMIPSM
ncbi:tripartite tricarboxylate transporter permease [Puniceibacterium confluentis]|uniref:tripartite tricarboxylate transporter permease n=3 Tax=Puniceibacterium confluentis TaxID=1958944 RepID=UPI0011B3A709|nr:tripartite tricarboxylate transporter permease [Puniceibacterium confluentis]